MVYKALVMDEFNRAFGRKLREARNEAGLSQDDLAKLVDLSRTSITNIEKGNQQPSLKLAVRLAAEVNKSLGDLTDESVDEASSKPAIKRTIERTLERYPAGNQEWFRSFVSNVDDD